MWIRPPPYTHSHLFSFKRLTQAKEQEDENVFPLTNLKYNLDSVKDESVSFLYKLRLGTKLKEAPYCSAQEMYKNIINKIQEAT